MPRNPIPYLWNSFFCFPNLVCLTCLPNEPSRFRQRVMKLYYHHVSHLFQLLQGPCCYWACCTLQSCFAQNIWDADLILTWAFVNLCVCYACQDCMRLVSSLKWSCCSLVLTHPRHIKDTGQSQELERDGGCSEEGNKKKRFGKTRCPFFEAFSCSSGFLRWPVVDCWQQSWSATRVWFAGHDVETLKASWLHGRELKTTSYAAEAQNKHVDDEPRPQRSFRLHQELFHSTLLSLSVWEREGERET